jgi:hypothetical protein
LDLKFAIEASVQLLFQQKSDFRLASFSETHDNELMWAHYASNYSGICLEYQYDMLSEKFGDTPQAELLPIEYSRKLFRVEEALLFDDPQTAREILRQKKSSWSYEKEWRLFTRNERQPIFPETITSIYLGLRIRDEAKAHLMGAVLEAFPEVDFYQMQVRGYRHKWKKLTPA